MSVFEECDNIKNLSLFFPSFFAKILGIWPWVECQMKTNVGAFSFGHQTDFRDIRIQYQHMYKSF